MADNPYGDADSSGANHGASVSQSKNTDLHKQLSQIITDHSKQLLDLVAKLRHEKKIADNLIHEKDAQIRTLQDELQLMKKKFANLTANGGIASNGPASSSASGGQMKTKTPIFLGMEKTDKLTTFIEKKIRPDTKFNKQCLGIIDKLVRSIQMKGSPFNIKRIVKSGSLGKGTSVKNKSDIDLIIFFNGYQSVMELQADKASLLQKLKDYIKKDWSDDLLFKGKTPFSVQFYLKIQEEDQNHEVDLLPAVDITQSGRELSDIYREMQALEPRDRDAYSCCFSPLQLEFVQATNRQSTPGKVKDLIRLLKNWAKDEDVPVRSYFLELLVIYLWREGGKPMDINMEDYLYKALQLLVDCKNMAISFTDNYNYKVYRPDLKKPFLLDPANPFRNVAPFSQRETDNVIRKAKIVLERGWSE